LLGAILVLNVYRAATQSITVDEASTWLNFASQPFGGLFAPYDANNHVLNSLLCGLSVSLFGLSEFALRLPSVLAGALYLASSWRISVLLFGYGAWASLTALLLATDPLLLDHLSAARGYGAALAFWLAGLCSLIRALNEEQPGYLLRCGVFFGLAIAANLTAVFPVTATAIAIIATRQRRIFSLKTLWDQFAVPAVLVSFIFLAIPLSKARPGDFYLGAPSFAAMIDSLADTSFSRANVFLNELHSLVWPAALLLTAAAVVCLPQLFCVALISVIALVFALHYAMGTPYPVTRTALYFIPLALLTASSILYRFHKVRVVAWGAGLAAVTLLAGFLLQVRTSYYDEWRFDAGTKTIAVYIRSHYGTKGAPLTIRASWTLQPSLNFYRQRYGLNWKTVERDKLESAGDVWVLSSAVAGEVERLQLRPVFRDRLSGAIVADRGVVRR
jgi:4-amino-4-deoxy-L-arabinose transferase-like glycosyltransferase